MELIGAAPQQRNELSLPRVQRDQLGAKHARQRIHPKVVRFVRMSIPHEHVVAVPSVEERLLHAHPVATTLAALVDSDETRSYDRRHVADGHVSLTVVRARAAEGVSHGDIEAECIGIEVHMAFVHPDERQVGPLCVEVEQVTVQLSRYARPIANTEWRWDVRHGLEIGDRYLGADARALSLRAGVALAEEQARRREARGGGQACATEEVPA